MDESHSPQNGRFSPARYWPVLPARLQQAARLVNTLGDDVLQHAAQRADVRQSLQAQDTLDQWIVPVHLTVAQFTEAQ